MKSEPLWQSAPRPRFSKLARSVQFDAVVVGGGITGLTAAYFLKKAGKKVCLVERDRIGFVDTGLTTAHLTYVTDLRIAELAKKFGKRSAATVLQAGSLAIDTIESITRAEKIDCDFRRVPGYLCTPFNSDQDETRSLKRDAKAAQSLGFPAQFSESVPHLNRPGARFPDQAKFHPLKYLAGLAKAVDGGGSAIFEKTEVTEVRDEPLCVVAGEAKIETEYLVIATHVPLMGKTGTIAAALFQSKLFPYSSYAIGAKVPQGLIPEACFWDTSDPYYYLRVERGGKTDYVIFGGEDHKTGQEPNTEQRFARLHVALRKLIPEARPDRQWSGQVIETNDGLPYIGETAERQFVATGFSGNGMTFGTLSGLMARDAAIEQDNPWKDLFSIHRKKLRGGAWNYVTENLDYPYYYLADRIARPDKSSTRSIKRGEAKIVAVDGQRAACSRDEHGRLHCVSAYCTHMGCLVRWNQAEQTWDCPCHGSRFRPNGDVLAGPAETPLEAIGKTKERSQAPRRAKRKPAAAASAKASSGRSETPRRPRSAARPRGR